MPEVPFEKRRRSSTSTVTSTDAIEAETTRLGAVVKRYGHPAAYKIDGYDIGLRYRVNGVMQSFFVACSRKTGEKVTMKEFHRVFYPADDTTITREIQLLSKLSHPSLPLLREVYVTDLSIFAITQYLDQQRLTHAVKDLTVADVRTIFSQLAQVVKFCHEKKVLLRNLTPQNIILVKARHQPSPDAPAWQVQVADLSFALEAQLATQPEQFSVAQHPLFDWKMVPFLAPETVLSQPCFCAADWWSMGVLLYHMLSRGALPFDHPVDHVLVRHITTAHFDYPDEIWEESDEDEEASSCEISIHSSGSGGGANTPRSESSSARLRRKVHAAEETHAREDAKVVIEGLLKVSPKERWSWKDCVKHGWMVWK